MYFEENCTTLGNLRVEATYLFYVLSVGEDFNEVTGLPGLDHDVVYVGLDGLPDVLAKHMGHASLVCGPYVSETEWHGYIVVHAEWGDERSRELVGLFHLDLMVTKIRIKER